MQLFNRVLESIVTCFLGGKGRTGEKIVAITLKQLPENKRIINDIMINDNGKSRQIDHILINNKGVFVIETKNYAGKIYGRETSENWTQYLNNKKFAFKNPIHQNYGHKQIICHLLKEEENIISIVAFTNRCNLKVECTKEHVIYTNELIDFINKQSIKLTDAQIEEYYNKIMDNKITNEEAIKNHQDNVIHYVKYKEELVDKNICPRCYGKLILKKGKYGDFMGCSNYPRCRYTKKLYNRNNL